MRTPHTAAVCRCHASATPLHYCAPRRRRPLHPDGIKRRRLPHMPAVSPARPSRRLSVRVLEHFTILLSPGSRDGEPFGEEPPGVWGSLDGHLPWETALREPSRLVQTGSRPTSHRGGHRSELGRGSDPLECLGTTARATAAAAGRSEVSTVMTLMICSAVCALMALAFQTDAACRRPR